MKICEKCNYVTDRSAVNFCYTDGTKLKDYDHRCSCGYFIGIHDRFCESCGKEVER